MADTAIEWTDKVWNPVTGCTKVSQGCKNCYAERVFPRAYGKDRKFTDVQCHEDRLEAPLRWSKPSRIFVNSMSDLFHESVPDQFIDAIFNVMALAPQHVFQILTKRPARMLEYMSHADRGETVHDAIYDQGLVEAGVLADNAVYRGQERILVKIKGETVFDFPWPLPNVWLGVSCEDQKTADERIPLLLQTPAAVRWISAEPLLGPIDLFQVHPSHCPQVSSVGIDTTPGNHPRKIWKCDSCDYLHRCVKIKNLTYEIPALDWVVVGGESGPNARPMHPDWARSLRDQCQAAGVPFFFKQWGEHIYTETRDWDHRLDKRYIECGEGWYQRVGKKEAGRLLDGREWSEYPKESL